MIKNYSEFILENLQRSKAIYKKMLEDYEEIKNKLEKNNRLGWMGKFTEFLFAGIPITELNNLYQSLEDLKKKNININIDSFKTYEAILDEIGKKELDYKLKSIINKFPKKQKDMVLANIVNPSGTRLDASFIKLADLENKNTFISKVSSYENFYDLNRALNLFIKSSGNKYTKEYVKSLLDPDLILVYEDEDLLILQTKTHEAISKIGGDTSWCIVRSKKTFLDYTKENRIQYVVIDYRREQFEPLYKIGFTVDMINNIIYAHDVLDKSVIPYTTELLKENKVLISDLNKLNSLDLDLLEKMTWSKAEAAITKSPIIEKSQIGKFLQIIEKITKKVIFPYYLVSMVISKASENLIKEEEFDKLKKFINKEEVFNRIKDILISKKVIIEKNPEDPFIYNIDIHYENYKNWKYYIRQDKIELFIRNATDKLKGPKSLQDKKWAEIVLSYLMKMRKAMGADWSLSSKFPDYQILTMLCESIIGKEIDINLLKSYLDKNTIRQISTVIMIKDIFDIKYHFSEVESIIGNYWDRINISKDNLIKEPIVIKDLYGLKEKISFLSDFDITIKIRRDTVISEMSGVVLKNTKDIEFKKVFFENQYLEKRWLINFKSIIEKGKNRKLKFKDNIQFPLTMKLLYYATTPPKEVTFIIE